MVPPDVSVSPPLMITERTVKLLVEYGTPRDVVALNCEVGTADTMVTVLPLVLMVPLKLKMLPAVPTVKLPVASNVPLSGAPMPWSPRPRATMLREIVPAAARTALGLLASVMAAPDPNRPCDKVSVPLVMVVGPE